MDLKDTINVECVDIAEVDDFILEIEVKGTIKDIGYITFDIDENGEIIWK